MEKKVIKFITVDNFEKEETYLEQMSKKGWHFVKYEGLRYFFESGDPINIIYQIDYHSSTDGDKEDYLQLFKDSGWIPVFAYPIFDGEWCYFKKETASNNSPKIYTDNESKIELFSKIRKTWGTFGLILSLVFLPITFVTGILTSNSFLIYFVLLIFVFIALLYIKMVLNLTSKIHQLRE